MKVFVNGAYQTKFGELWDKGLDDLMVEAGKGAVLDAGVEMQKIDAVYVGSKLSAWVMGQNHLGGLAAEVLGVNVPVTMVEAACASGGVAVREAIMAVESGRYKNVLVVGVEKMTDVSSEVVAEALMGAASSQERNAGLTFPGLYALMAREYMSQYGLKSEDLALVSVKNHKHGSLNQNAHFGFGVSVEQVIKSPMVASPLRLLDCSGVSDGAAAVVVSSKRNKKSVEVLGSGQASDSLGLSGRESLVEIKATRLAVEMATKEAGIEVEKDVDVLEVHDCFSIAEIMALEDLGLAEKGRGIELFWSREVELEGKRPVNTSGGLKACGHPVGATGVKQVVEVVKQLRGGLGERQVKGAKIGLTHNVGGTGATVVVHVLGR